MRGSFGFSVWLRLLMADIMRLRYLGRQTLGWGVASLDYAMGGGVAGVLTVAGDLGSCSVRFDSYGIGKRRGMQRIKNGADSGSGQAASLLPRGLIMNLVGLALVVAALGWAYREVLVGLWKVWMNNDNYSCGLLVPVLAAYVAYTRRRVYATIELRPCYLGLVLIALSFAMLFAGEFLLFGSAKRISLVFLAAGIVLTIYGIKLTRQVFWILLFLFLMLPWPNRVYQAVSLPLQGWATTSSVFMLELLGWLVIREGNVIHIGETTVAVAEACSGLRMLTAFMIVSALVAFLSYRRAMWEKAVIVVSGVIIAVLCNTIRLTATAIAFTAGYGERVNQWFHDFGGIAMMPLALGMLLGELWLLKRLFVEAPVEDDGPSSGDVKTDNPNTPAKA